MGERFIRIKPGELRDHDLIVVAPTGSGKTTSVLRAVVSLVPGEYRRAVILAPTKALMSELVEKLKRMLREKYGFAAERMVGVDNSDAKLEPDWRFSEVWSRPFVVTSYERFDALVTRDPSILKNSIIVIDEAHNLLNPQRATALIDILANVKMARDKGWRVRVALLSATMPEVESLKEYLGAELKVHNVRPVELKIERITRHVYGRGTRNYYYSKMDAILEALRRYPKPALIYVPSRYMSEEIAKTLEEHGFKAVPFHAGMPYSERKRIQAEMMKPNPSIDVVVATDTLSQGVNMSFRTVIIPGLKRFMKGGYEYVDPATIRQVMGRAGRPEYGYNEGYVVIIEAPDEAEVVERALRSEYGEVREPGDYAGLVLRLIATGRNPETWARYAYKVDRGKMLTAIELLRRLGLVRENGELDPLGRVLAYNYIEGVAIPVFYAVALLERSEGKSVEELRKLDPVTRALLYSVSAAYYMNRGWSRRNELERKIAFGANVDTSILSDAPLYMLNNAVYEQLGLDAGVDTVTSNTASVLADLLYFADQNAPTDLAAPEAYVTALANPDVINVDNDLEAVRKAAGVLQDMAKTGLVSKDLLIGAKVVESVARAYRRLLRNARPREVKTFLPAVIRAVRRLLSERRDIDPGVIPELVDDASIVYLSLAKARGGEAPPIDEAVDKILLTWRPKLRGMAGGEKRQRRHRAGRRYWGGQAEPA